MFESDSLLTIAELAVGLIGISGIVTVFLSHGELHKADRFRFAVLVVNGTTVMVFALVPIWLANFIESSHLLWRIASASGFLVALILIVPIRGYARIFSSVITIGSSALLDRFATILAIVGFTVSLLNVLGWPLPPNEVLYEIGLTQSLVQVVLMFTGLVINRPQ